MKPSIASAAVFLLALGVVLSAQQKPEGSCDFTLSGTQAKPNITGPEAIIAITHIVDQPDSPIQIVSADFKGSFVSISNGRYTEQLDCSIKLRNRSDQAVRSFHTISGVTPGDVGFAALTGFEALPELPSGRSLMPGQELEMQGCGGRGDGGAPNNRVRVLLAVESVSLNGCVYVPSRRFPTL